MAFVWFVSRNFDKMLLIKFAHPGKLSVDVYDTSGIKVYSKKETGKVLSLEKLNGTEAVHIIKTDQIPKFILC